MTRQCGISTNHDINDNHGSGESRRSIITPTQLAVTIIFVFIFFLVILCGPGVQLAYAGGPYKVAGVSYFNPNTKGTPLTWTAGTITYFTDQGDLSPVLPQTAANAMVADAFSRWTGVASASLQAARGGSLNEDVSGLNVSTFNGLMLPTDILPAAINEPVAIVYDLDGAVTEAVLGSGASDPSLCSTNSAYGGPDNYSADAHYLHALVVINGRCAATTASLPDLEYHLVRVLGRVLGLDWSQLNENVLSGNPPPKAEDYAGLPLMHPLDPFCTSITGCLRNLGFPNQDDRGALSRLYPASASATATIHGSVYFVDAGGNRAQPMQGVNVVARWVDPTSGMASGQYAAASVSGYGFLGNDGNVISGTTDVSGNRFDQFGSDDPALEGYFELGGLEFPDGRATATFQLSVEAVNPLYTGTIGVGPYDYGQVTPAGTFAPVTVTVTAGTTTDFDIVMQGSAPVSTDLLEPSTFLSPAPVPGGGDWIASLSGYGDSDFYSFSGHANRTLSVLVTALDVNGNPTTNKAMPLIGIWNVTDPVGTPPPAFVGQAFNSLQVGVTRLDAILLSDTGFLMGVADVRGDGRPDYRYRARIFYGDSIAPERVSAQGGTLLAVTGLGLRTGVTVSVGASLRPILAFAPNDLQVASPTGLEGVQDVTLTDPLSGATAVMTGALTIGAAATDTLLLVQGSNPATVVGGTSVNPFRVRVVESDGVTPVAGATVQLSAAPANVQFAACGGGVSCSLYSGENGEVSSLMTPIVAGTYTLTATLAPLLYSPPNLVQATLAATSSSLDIALVNGTRFVASGASLALTLQARVLTLGKPVTARSIVYSVIEGAGTLTASTANTDSNGYAQVSLNLSAVSTEVQVSACVDGKAPCQTFSVLVVPTSLLQLHNVAGDGTGVAVGTAVPALVFAVTDSSSPSNAVQGASITVQTLVLRPQAAATSEPPVIVSANTHGVLSDANGLVSVVPVTEVGWGPVEVEVLATAPTGGTASALATVQVLAAAQ